MMSFAYWFAGGGLFYPGLAACLVGLVVLRVTERGLYAAVARVFALIGALLVVLSAVPLPPWLYVVWAASLLVFFVNSAQVSKRAQRTSTTAFVACVVATVALGTMEWPYRSLPSLPFKQAGTLYSIGDSLSMGADTMEGNWPALLAAKSGMSVKSFAFGGARLKSALSNAKRVESDASLVIVELGGNDIFYDTTSVDFAANLEAILSELKRQNAPLVLIELPLPPFYNRFGTAQRRLARKYEAILVPRRVLAQVLASPGATVDNLHLSPAGHELLAQTLWEMR
ncbi:MAG: GDSL-type esterase/lipase family protein [Candidatus Hydrogenedentales bacterium]|jgi:lysophospholipase L1-like esterase